TRREGAQTCFLREDPPHCLIRPGPSGAWVCVKPFFSSGGAMHTEKLRDAPAALLPFRRWKIRWGSIAFLGLLHAVALVGTPWYIATHAVSTAEWALFGIYTLATGFSVTVGEHRLFAHTAFRACAPVRFLLLFFGPPSFQQSALKGPPLHPPHHQLVDPPADPYNIK